MAFKELDPVLHSQLRLAIVSLLMKNEEVDFNTIKDKTNATPGNISVQLTRLKEVGYIEVIKTFQNNYPLTLCKITPEGSAAFSKYLDALKSYMNLGHNK